MKLFSIFGRPSAPSASTPPAWRRRETALVWGLPLVLFAALTIIPVTVSLLLFPCFPHGRLVGVALLPVIAGCEIHGIARLAFCLSGDFDLLSVIAGAAVVVLVVIAMCTGVLLSIVI
jgi:hypothetical protein